MGYKEQKLAVDEKLKRIKRILLLVVVFLLTALVVFSCFYPPESWKYYFDMPNVPKRKAGEMRLHFIDVEQGDCSLIELPDGQIVLVDGGNGTRKTERTVLRYLNALGIEEIDHLIITHTDNEHCGAIDEVVKQKKVLNAYLPATSKITDGEYAEAYAALIKEDCALYEAERTIRLKGDKYPYQLSFVYPYSATAWLEGDEVTSSVFWLDYQGVSALFMGDAGLDVENSLLRDDAFGFLADEVDLKSTEILKTAHHGSNASTSRDFLSYLGVKTAIISCGKDNPYGYPLPEVLDNLAWHGAAVHRTDLQGNILITVRPNGEYTVD